VTEGVSLAKEVKTASGDMGGNQRTRGNFSLTLHARRGVDQTSKEKGNPVPKAGKNLRILISNRSCRRSRKERGSGLEKAGRRGILRSIITEKTTTRTKTQPLHRIPLIGGRPRQASEKGVQKGDRAVPYIGEVIHSKGTRARQLEGGGTLGEPQKSIKDSGEGKKKTGRESRKGLKRK